MLLSPMFYKISFFYYVFVNGECMSMCAGACGASDNPKVHSGCELPSVSTVYRIS